MSTISGAYFPHIQFKVLVITFKALCSLGPSCLLNDVSQCHLKISSDGPRMVHLAAVQAQAFSAVGPLLWNGLPPWVWCAEVKRPLSPPGKEQGPQGG